MASLPAALTSRSGRLAAVTAVTAAPGERARAGAVSELCFFVIKTCNLSPQLLPNKTSSFVCPAGNASCALNYSQDVPCPETYRAAGEPQGFGCSSNGQWRGLVPTPSSALPKLRLSRGSYLEARKNPRSRCSNSSKTIVKETPSNNSKLFEAHSVEPASSATSILGAQEQPSHKPPLYSTPSYPSNIFESRNSTAQHQQENLPASNAQSEGSDSVILLKVKDSRTPAPSLPFFQAELWIKELTSVYDSRARERWRQIEEQKALALQLQSQRLQEQEHSVQEQVDLNLRVPLEKEIPVTVVPEKKEGAKSAEGEEEFPEITEEMEKEIKNVFRGGNQDEVLSEAFRLTITRKDIQTLNNLNWLNDEIINFYMNLLMERSKEKGLPTVHAFNTFFFTKLKTAGYQAVKRWTKKVDIFSVDLLLVPIHLGVHWCLAVVDFRKKTITYYDSMGGINSEACRILLQYLKQESLDKKRKEFDTNGWSLLSKKSQEIPQQMNGSDCGMFACKYADCITKDKPINFTQ
ncbi:UNVERIFIED_CONTAM: hypothetical protein H355_008597, partial [Colinus virginianus]